VVEVFTPPVVVEDFVVEPLSKKFMVLLGLKIKFQFPDADLVLEFVLLLSFPFKPAPRSTP
jgi:hypothetical protein